MSKVVEVTKTRTCFDTVVYKKEEYQIFVTTNGEEFHNKSSAEKYQAKIDRSQAFSQRFSNSLKNLKNGSLTLAKRISGNPNVSDDQIMDYFWVKPKDKEERGFLKGFISKHYNIGVYGTNEIKFEDNKWTFVSVKNRPSNGYNEVYYCDLETITNEIDTLKSLVPDFEVKDIEATEEDDDDSRFGILDFSGDK